MTIRASRENLKIDVVAFEARYKDGYRYLDHCGETIVQVQHRNPQWVVNNATSHSGQLRNDDLNMSLIFGTTGAAFSISKTPIEMKDAGSVVEKFAREAEAIYQIITRGTQCG